MTSGEVAAAQVAEMVLRLARGKLMADGSGQAHEEMHPRGNMRLNP